MGSPGRGRYSQYTVLLLHRYLRVGGRGGLVHGVSIGSVTSHLLALEREAQVAAAGRALKADIFLCIYTHMHKANVSNTLPTTFVLCRVLPFCRLSLERGPLSARWRQEMPSAQLRRTHEACEPCLLSFQCYKYHLFRLTFSPPLLRTSSIHHHLDDTTVPSPQCPQGTEDGVPSHSTTADNAGLRAQVVALHADEGPPGQSLRGLARGTRHLLRDNDSGRGLAPGRAP